jgi:hypothetical protein
MGHCGAEISNLLKSNKAFTFSPERFETELFQNWCLPFRLPAKTDLPLKLNSSLI